MNFLFYAFSVILVLLTISAQTLTVLHFLGSACKINLWISCVLKLNLLSMLIVVSVCQLFLPLLDDFNVMICQVQLSIALLIDEKAFEQRHEL